MKDEKIDSMLDRVLGQQHSAPKPDNKDPVKDEKTQEDKAIENLLDRLKI